MAHQFLGFTLWELTRGRPQAAPGEATYGGRPHATVAPVKL